MVVNMRFFKRIFNGLTISILLSLVLCITLFKFQGNLNALNEKDKEIKVLTKELMETRNFFDELKLQYGSLQTDSRQREGDLMRELQEVRDRIKSIPETPMANTPTPAPKTLEDSEKKSPAKKSSKRSG